MFIEKTSSTDRHEIRGDRCGPSPYRRGEGLRNLRRQTGQNRDESIALEKKDLRV